MSRLFAENVVRCAVKILRNGANDANPGDDHGCSASWLRQLADELETELASALEARDDIGLPD